ncbi:MAG: sigma-70 family RNA polymerase sigma factor [Balneolaceae bacterium]|nr:sigma-70 family RNA polymerase sigma factor [Balneolaceae bacterium]
MEITIVQLLLILASSLGDADQSELYLKIKKGDKKAFRAFFDEHHSPLMQFLLSKGITGAQAQDLVQGAYIYIWEHRHKIDPEKSLRSYLFRIAYTRMLNHFRDTKKYDQNQPSTEHPGKEETDSSLLNKELAEAIEQAIQAMPEKRQNVFRLCFLQKFTYREAAEFCKVSVKTIENHMALALKDLRRDLEKFKK